MERNTPIRLLAEDDRPREKLILKGRTALSYAELLAVLINSGTSRFSALEIARQILESCGNNLEFLSKLDRVAFSGFEGIGEAKAVTLIAALELGRRRKFSSQSEVSKIQCSQDAYRVLEPVFMDLDHEQFWVIYLSAANRVLGSECISKGGLTGTVADMRIILRKALYSKATAMIVAHNHPSGSTQPSDADIRLTRKLKSASETLDLKLLDHVIIGDPSYLSFADEGIVF
jgi:DNA repair protein RadC